MSCRIWIWNNSHERCLEAVKNRSCFYRFDTSDNGRRLASVVEDGKLKIKTVSDSPEIRNLSDADEEMLSHNNISGDDSDEDDGTDNQTASSSSC